MGKKKLVRIIFPDKLNKPVGGLSIVASKIKKYLSNDFDIEFIGQPQGEEMKGYKESPFPLNIGHGSLNTITCQISYFANSVVGIKPDLIHAFDWSVFMAGVYASRHYGVPLISSMQLSINELGRAGITYTGNPNSHDGYWISETHKQIELMGLINSSKIIHVSKSYSENFKEFSNKSIVIQNGVDFEDLKGDKIELPGNRPMKVIYIGRFATMKNILEITKSKIPDNMDLIYVGKDDGGERFNFDAMLKHVKDNDNVHYYGPAFGKEKADLLESADAVLFPSIHEPFGIVGLEAMATKNILLTSRANGISDYANDSNSIYCGFDSYSISLALKYLSVLPEEEKRRLISSGLETAKEFNWERSMNLYRETYKSLL